MKGFGAIAAYVGSVLGVTIGMYLYAIEAWLAPFEPVLYLAVFVLVALSLMGGYWFHVTKEETKRGIGHDGLSAEEIGFKRLTELTGQFVLGCVALLVMLTWAIPQVRSIWVGYIDTNPVQLGYALEDPSPLVLTKACTAMFDQGVGPWRERLATRLSKSPGAAVTCLKTAIDNERGAASVVARMTVAQWSSDLRTSSEYESFNACEKTDALKTVEAMMDRNPEVMIVQCAMKAHSSTARECCAARSESLVTLQSAVKPESVERMKVLDMLPELLRSAFSPNDDDMDVVDSLDLEDGVLQKNVFQIACSALGSGEEENPEVEEALSRNIAGGKCIPTDAITAQLLSSRIWTNVCSTVLSGEVSRDTICEELNLQNTNIAVEAAMGKSVAAHTAYARLEYAMSFQEGVRKAAGMGGGGKKDEKREALLDRSAAEVMGAPTTYDATCQRLEYDPMDRRGFEKAKVVTSINCNRLDPNLTYREFLESRKKRRRETKRLMKAPFSKKNDKLIKKRLKENGRDVKDSDLDRFRKESAKSVPKIVKSSKKKR